MLSDFGIFFILSTTVVLVGPEEPCTIDYATADAHICAPPETCLLCSGEVSGICSGEASGMAAWEHLLLVCVDPKNIEFNVSPVVCFRSFPFCQFNIYTYK